MKKIILLLAVISASLGSHAQLLSGRTGSADMYFEKGDYFSAAMAYQRYLGGMPDTPRAGLVYLPYGPLNERPAMPRKAKPSLLPIYYKLGESFRRFHDPAGASRWYAEVLQLDSLGLKFPLAAYHQAACLRATGALEEAERMLQRFLDRYKGDALVTEAARRELEGLSFIRAQYADSNGVRLKVHAAGTAFNADGSSYAPFQNGDTLFYTASRRSESGPYTNRVYRYSMEDDTASSVLVIPGQQGWEEGAGVFTPGGDRVYFTRWEEKGAGKISTVWMAEKKGEGYGAPVKLEALAPEGFSARQPALIGNKILLYASDKPGGAGGFDLYSTQLDEKGLPGSPVNMGTAVNSYANEQTPFYHRPSGTLVFSSNRGGGMGGYDLYAAKGEPGIWGAPKNMGYPVNSLRDDQYFFSASKHDLYENAWLSSDRASVCCLELFRITESPYIVRGRVVACKELQPLGNASVSLLAPGIQQPIAVTTTDEGGYYYFKLPRPVHAEIVFSKQGYLNKALRPEMGTDTLFAKEICLEAEPVKPFVVGKAVVLKDIFYDFNKATLRPESYPVLDTLANVIKRFPGMLIELSAHTDSKGTDAYNQKLSDARARSCVEYLLSKGVAMENLQSKGYGESKPVAPNTLNGKDNPAGRQLNRRTELVVIHY